MQLRALTTAFSSRLSRSMSLTVSAAFDSGNIEVESVAGGVAKLRLRPEPFTEGTDKRAHSQWFYFKASNVSQTTTRFEIGGLLESSYPEAWPGYHVAATHDRERWFRLDTAYDGASGTLSWTLPPGEASQVYFAYFAPYSYERHQDLIARCCASPLATVEVIGSSLDGRDLELVSAGTGPLNLWVAARQHPGESMAEWLADGLLRRLLDPVDPVAAALLRLATVRVVPNMNPDGSIRGHLRTNACGANLNREWASTGEYAAPTLERSPEVFHVLRKLDELGCDAYVDVHGDEEIPANFFAGTQGIPAWTPRLASLFRAFSAAYAHASPDFQTVKGYGDDEPGQANLAICGDQVAQRFDCLAVTLEMPFKDSTFDTPMPECGWTPQRAERLGASLLDALLDVAPTLRA